MATTNPDDILSKLLQSANGVDPNQQVDATPYLPTYSDTPQQEAQRQGSLQYDSQIDALNRQRQQTLADTADQVGVQQRYGQLVDPRLANVYSALGNSLTGDRQATQQNYSSAIDKIRSFYDQANQSNQQLNTDLLGRITSQAQGLGLEAALPGATQGLNRDYGFAQGQANNAKASDSANLASLAANIYGLDTARVSSSAQEGAQLRGSVQQDIVNAIADLQKTGQKQAADILAQVTGVTRDKATAIAQLVDQITNQRSTDAITARKDALAEFLQRQQLASSQRQEQEGLAQFLSSQAEQKRQFDTSQANENARAAAARASSGGGGGGSGGDPLSQMLKMMEIQNYGGQIDARNKQNLTGQDALNYFLSHPNAAWGNQTKTTMVGGILKRPKTTVVGPNPSAGPKFTSAMNQIISDAHAEAQRIQSAGGKADPYSIALQMASGKYKQGKKTYSIGGMNSDALRQGVNYFFKGYTVPSNSGSNQASALLALLGG